MKIALVSLDQQWENKDANKQKVAATLALIAARYTDIDLVVYPEMTLTGFTMESERIKEEEGSSDTIAFFEEQAKKYGVNIAFGVVLAKGDKASNCLAVVSGQGALLTTYTKIHPFSYANEDAHYQAANSLKKVNIGGATIGLTICYDLRFPEFFRAQIRAEACFGYGVIGKVFRQSGGGNGVAAVGDVGERAAVYEGGRAFDGLHQVGLDGVFEQCRHRAVCFQVFGVNGAAVFGVGDEDVAQTLFQIADVFGKAEYRHDFGGDGDVEAVGTNHAVNGFAHAVDDVAQLAVVHIDHTTPQDAFRIDIQFIALVDMVVEHGGEQVIRRTDSVEVAGEVQINVFHRQNLGIAAARRAAFDAEHRPQRRLAQGDNGVFADVAQRVRQTDGDGGFAFARRSRVDGGNQNQTALFLRQFERFGRIDFGFVMAVGFDIVNVQTQLGGNFANRTHSGRLGDFGIGFEAHDFPLLNGEEKEEGRLKAHRKDKR